MREVYGQFHERGKLYVIHIDKDNNYRFHHWDRTYPKGDGLILDPNMTFKLFLIY